jgi:putative transposase
LKVQSQFHIIGIMRRIGDYYLNRATSWEEIKKAHRKFVRDYNSQIHFAHQKRRDNRHSAQEVLRGVLARTIPEPALARILFATQFTRHLDRSGYIRFRRWRFYAEAGLAKQEVQIHLYTSTLKVEYPTGCATSCKGKGNRLRRHVHSSGLEAFRGEAFLP